MQTVISLFSSSADLSMLEQATVIPVTESEPAITPLPGAVEHPGISVSPTPQKPKPVKLRKGQKTNWQQYVKKNFAETPLPEIVAHILEEQPTMALEISAVVDTIFTNDIPREIQGRAHARVSNILSEGARDGRWYRCKLGKIACYSMDKQAVKKTVNRAKQPTGKALAKLNASTSEVSIELKLPRGYGKSITNQYEPTLDKLLPQEAKERSAYLKAIIQETEAGKEFLMRIAKALTKKYKGRPGMIPAYRGLLEKAKIIQESMA
ncbi:MAG: hypothetical protein F6K19_38465 [Cyanothece sp. SIO1E1]|nr:hypothetical protein [Cyanothece sp. SIO1E1]